MTMTQAFQQAPAALLAPLDYLALLFAMLYGLWIWNERPDAFLAAGAAIVVAAGLYILHRETVLARERGRSVVRATGHDRQDDKSAGG